jgi:hypothetical protein
VCRRLDLLREAERRETRAEGEQTHEHGEKCRGSTSSPMVTHRPPGGLPQDSRTSRRTVKRRARGLLLVYRNVLP